MPYLGHRDSDYAEMGISAKATPVDAFTPLQNRAARVVAELAHDDADRALLLEALGLTPTTDELAVAG